MNINLMYVYAGLSDKIPEEQERINSAPAYCRPDTLTMVKI
jgi:hypothetical protein